MPAPTLNPHTGQPDYSAAWIEYYRRQGMHEYADMIARQAQQQYQAPYQGAAGANPVSQTSQSGSAPTGVAAPGQQPGQAAAQGAGGQPQHPSAGASAAAPGQQTQQPGYPTDPAQQVNCYFSVNSSAGSSRTAPFRNKSENIVLKCRFQVNHKYRFKMRLSGMRS